ncbi:DUF6119 family protein [Novosphingobium sp. FSW06-99]|uniref:DUF6119 family protein n=1 Tax=Novosphingobium sp. FSW06-99 TaxID=1739113 RepID=UPI000B25FBCC|nr:DUF6119 family protein [Novosphingobium sp. FSW06-99]
MTKKSQTVSIRLLRDGKQPSNSIRAGVTLTPWYKLEGAQIALDTIGGGAPKWAKFLELTEAEKASLYNVTAYGLVFVQSGGRWFAVSFGLGHVKLDPDAFEQDFGLRVVLNTVDPDKLRSADVRTPDENTTSRRTQTARRSDQTAFSIDIERDIVRGLAGEPKDAAFASRVAGSDGLTLTKEMEVNDLPQVCADAFAAFGKTDYQANFAWIDQIKHVRDKATIELLDAALVAALHGCLAGAIPDTLHLAYPVIYDPEKARQIRYKGFGCWNIHTDLEIADYVADMREKPLTTYEPGNLATHRVHEVNDEGKDDGQFWRIKECLVFETDLNGEKYVLSADRWYKIDTNLATAVTAFFAGIDQHTMPPAVAGDNEDKYNKRIATAGHNMLCLDRKLVKPTGASYAIEACDFLQNDGAMIHIKDQTSSSRLSHLFNQGTVSARVMKMDGAFRDRLRAEIVKQEAALTLTGYQTLVVDAGTPFDVDAHLIVYAVLSSGVAAGTSRLPFFSLVTFRQAVNELRALGYKCAFAWIAKPASAKTKAKRKTAHPGAQAT